jgi:hypothetical protein
MNDGSKSIIPGLLPCAIALFLLSSMAAHAQNGPGSTGGSYLSLPTSVRSIAMGEVSAALASDPFGWLSNPGAAFNLPGVGISHSQWMIDTHYDNAFYRQKVGALIALGVGLTYLSSPAIPGYDESGEPIGDLENNSFQGVGGISLYPVKGLGVGINVKYFQEKIADWMAKGYGVDVGGTYTLPFPELSFGALVQNIGPNIKFISHEEELPLTTRFGISWRFSVIPKTVGFTLAADMAKPKNEEAYAALGGEITILDILSVRAGYSDDKARAADGFTAGGGLKLLKRLCLDYAWTPYGDLGSFHRVSVFFGL